MVKCQPVTVARWRKLDYFREEFDRQVKLYRANFDDVPLADRKERVKALQSIYEDLQERDKAMKLKVLMAIRQEVGDDKQVVEHHVSGAVGVNLPPRAESYSEWLEQNSSMYKAVGEVPVPSIEAVPAEKGRESEGPWEQTTDEDIPLWYTDNKGRAVLPNAYQERVERAKTWEDKDAEKVAEDLTRLQDAMRSVQEDEAMDITRQEVPIG